MFLMYAKSLFFTRFLKSGRKLQVQLAEREAEKVAPETRRLLQGQLRKKIMYNAIIQQCGKIKTIFCKKC